MFYKLSARLKWFHIQFSHISAGHLRYLVDVLNPVFWTTAQEVATAVNGYTLTKGQIVGEVQVMFPSGEILKMSQYARGVDGSGVLQIDVIVHGDVPDISTDSEIQLVPYNEEYIQTGLG